MSLNKISHFIRNRRSTFIPGLVEGGKIEDSVIEEILKNCVWAPSHGLAQVWAFKVFSDKGVDSFFRVQQEIYKAITPEKKFNEIKYEKYAEKSQRVSHVIAVVAQRDPKKRFPKQEDIVSVSCTVQNIYLLMQEYGIAGYLSTGDICYSKQIREFLNLEGEDECLGFFILGIADENYKKGGRRRIPAREKTEWIKD